MPSQPAPIPRTKAELAEAAALRGLVIPEPCTQGVLANLALLAGHAERLRTAPKGRP